MHPVKTLLKYSGRRHADTCCWRPSVRACSSVQPGLCCATLTRHLVTPVTPDPCSQPVAATAMLPHPQPANNAPSSALIWAFSCGQHSNGTCQAHILRPRAALAFASLQLRLAPRLQRSNELDISSDSSCPGKQMQDALSTHDQINQNN